MTNAERQASLRARRAADGLSEVRGIYLPTELHERLKATARRMLRALERKKHNA